MNEGMTIFYNESDDDDDIDDDLQAAAADNSRFSQEQENANNGNNRNRMRGQNDWVHNSDMMMMSGGNRGQTNENTIRSSTLQNLNTGVRINSLVDPKTFVNPSNKQVKHYKPLGNRLSDQWLEEEFKGDGNEETNISGGNGGGVGGGGRAVLDRDRMRVGNSHAKAGNVHRP